LNQYQGQDYQIIVNFAHLRMRNSSLNEHLYIKNIINNPKCLCGEIESTYHYSFKCPKYTRQRNSLFRKLFQHEDERVIFVSGLDRNNNI
jgi:hypothetical protein